jgi:hypothetical protein
MINIPLLKRAFIITSFAFTPLVIQAQKGNGATDSTATTPSVAKTNTDTTKQGKSFGAMSLGLHAGSSGIGLQYNITLNKYFTGRFEGSYIAKKDYIYNLVSDGVNVKNDISVATGLIGLFADIHSPKAKFLNVTFGVVYDLTSIKLDQSFVNASPSKDLGTLTLTSKINHVNPYVGIMLGNPIPKKKVNLSFEMGTYYIGAPKVTWTGQGIVAPTADQSAIIERNIKNYSWMPVLSLHLNYKIN